MSSPAPADNSREGIDLSDLRPGTTAEDVEQAETFLQADDGEELFCQSWAPRDPRSTPRAVVCLMHGYGEHSSRYGHVGSALARLGYRIAAIDARGHGRSTGERAYIDSYQHYVDDYQQLFDWAAARWSTDRIFGLAHSNGGLIALRHAQTHPDTADGYALTSPMCGFADDIPPLKALSGRLLSRIWPSFSMATEVDPSTLTHDEAVVDAYEQDPLVLQSATARWFTEALAAQRAALASADRLEQSFLFLVAGDDALTAPEASRSLFDAMAATDREFELYPDLYHELLNETEWQTIVRRIHEWFRRRDGGDLEGDR
ncbi:MAG: lysophospholipase [Bradymonadaceae bacterium]